MGVIYIENGASHEFNHKFRDGGRALVGSGDGVTPELYVYRESDGQYWTGTGQTFQVTRVDAVLVEDADTTNHKGLFAKTFATTGLSDDTYHVSIIDPSNTAFNVPVKGDLIVGGFVDDMALSRKALVNRLELDEGNPGLHILYDDDDSVLLTFNITDKDGNKITIPVGIPARRTKGV